MLELDWPNLQQGNGVTPPIAYVHGELFGVGGVKTAPDNPRGERSMSIENRCKGKGEWNTYDVVAVDGVIKLSVNGKFVNGISKSTQKKGYLCLESEGAEIHFRNIRIMELPPGVTSRSRRRRSWTDSWRNGRTEVRPYAYNLCSARLFHELADDRVDVALGVKAERERARDVERAGPRATMRAVCGSSSTRTCARAAAPPSRSRLSSISPGVTVRPGRFTTRRPSERGSRHARRVHQVRVALSGELIHRRVSSGTGHTALDARQRLADDAAHERRQRRVRLRRAGPPPSARGRRRRRRSRGASTRGTSSLGDRLRGAVRRLRPQRMSSGTTPGSGPPNTAIVLVKTKRGGARQTRGTPRAARAWRRR